MRKLDKACQVDGVPLLIPDGDLAMHFQDLDSPDSGRDESGYMHRFVMRERVKTWEFSYGFLTAEEYQYLESLFCGKQTFLFRFPAPDGTAQICRAYCAKSSIVLHNRQLGIYRNLKFNIIEC